MSLEESPAVRRGGERRWQEKPRRRSSRCCAATRRQVLLAVGARIGVDVAFYVFVLFITTYVVTYLELPSSYALNAVLIAAACQVVFIPIFGALSDRFGRRPVLLVGAIGARSGSFVFFALLDTGSFPLIVLAASWRCCCTRRCTARRRRSSPRCSRPQVRYTGASMGYQLAGILGGALAPIIATALLDQLRQLVRGVYLRRGGAGGGGAVRAAGEGDLEVRHRRRRHAQLLVVDRGRGRSGAVPAPAQFRGGRNPRLRPPESLGHGGQPSADPRPFVGRSRRGSLLPEPESVISLPASRSGADRVWWRSVVPAAALSRSEPCSVLPCLACTVLSRLVLSCLTLSRLRLSCSTLSRSRLSCLAFSPLALSPLLLRLAFSCLALLCWALPCWRHPAGPCRAWCCCRRSCVALSRVSRCRSDAHRAADRRGRTSTCPRRARTCRDRDPGCGRRGRSGAGCRRHSPLGWSVRSCSAGRRPAWRPGPERVPLCPRSGAAAAVVCRGCGRRGRLGFGAQPGRGRPAANALRLAGGPRVSGCRGRGGWCDRRPGRGLCSGAAERRGRHGGAAGLSRGRLRAVQRRARDDKQPASAPAGVAVGAPGGMVGGSRDGKAGSDGVCAASAVAGVRSSGNRRRGPAA